MSAAQTFLLGLFTDDVPIDCGGMADGLTGCYGKLPVVGIAVTAAVAGAALLGHAVLALLLPQILNTMVGVPAPDDGAPAPVGQLAERTPPVQGVPRAVSASTVQPVPAVRGAVTGPSPVGVALGGHGVKSNEMRGEAAPMPEHERAPSGDRVDGLSRVDDVSRVDVEPELRPTTNLGPVYPSAVGRTGADLPQQVRDLVDQAKQRLLSTYPESDRLTQRLRDLDDIASLADRLDTAADHARRSGDLGDLVQRVRDLSAGVNDYASNYRDWQNFDQRGRVTDPGWADLHGVDPLNSVELANRIMGIDPQTHQFHVIDQAIAVAKIGDVMGPEFEVHAANTLARSLPMDLDHARARLSPEDFARLEPSIRERPAAFYD
ncbi:hypothetical protein, partial [Micromonospora sonneratiae]